MKWKERRVEVEEEKAMAEEEKDDEEEKEDVARSDEGKKAKDKITRAIRMKRPTRKRE